MLTSEDIRYLFNELRRASVKWSGRKEVLKLARRKVFLRYSKTGKAIYKFQWQCAGCQKWFKNDKELEVDHISEIGGITEFSGDWNDTIAKIFPRPVDKHLQALCISCHKKKTGIFLAANHKYKRKDGS